MTAGPRPLITDLRLLILHGSKKGAELHFVELAVSSNTTANIHGKRTNRSDRASNVIASESARKKNWNRDCLGNLSAHTPIVRATCTTQFLYWQGLIS